MLDESVKPKEYHEVRMVGGPLHGSVMQLDREKFSYRDKASGAEYVRITEGDRNTRDGFWIAFVLKGLSGRDLCERLASVRPGLPATPPAQIPPQCGTG